jgi:NAD(P)-dependent dehydrogenase (short-subunit alcohol dehydrogenase family)
MFAGSGARRVDLPVYAFQRQRYWPALAPYQAQDALVPDGAEAGFWAAVERQDLQALAGAVGADGAQQSWVSQMAPALPVLAAWRRRRREASAVDRWRYRVTWEPVAAVTDSAVLGGRWLLVVPAVLAGSGLAAACEQVLADGGAQVAVVAAALDRHVLAGALRQAAEGSGGSGISGVLSLLALEEAGPSGCPEAAAGVAGTLLLVQALGDVGLEARLWVLTTGAVTAGKAGRVSAAQAQTWGLGRVAALEHPRRWGGLIDVPPVITGRTAGWLRAVLAGETGEDQVAIRQEGVLARRLVRAPATISAWPWRPSGPVLITGGTGALGGHVARWLAGRGAPRTVLVSRHGIAAAGAARLAAQVCGAGADVMVAACDAGDQADLAALWRRLAGAGIPVRAVVHAAGAGQATALADVSLAELAGVCGAKVAGAVQLDALAGDTVEAFVLFSSVAATWGSSGQAVYAAANAALDALAEDRQARGLAATSVAWGLWGAGGMAAGAEEVLIRRGLRVMPPRLAITALGQALDGGETCTVVADMDWQQFVPAFTMARPSPLLSGVAEARQVMETETSAPVSGEAEGGRRELMRRLAEAPAAELDRILLDLVRIQAATVLGHPSADAIDSKRAFLELGFDSITAVELRNRLNATTGLRLPATAVFDFLTPLALSHFLRSELDAVGQREDQASAASVPPPAASTGGLGDLYNQALRDGKSDEFIELMQDVAKFRPSFDEPDGENAVRPARIAAGAAQPGLICFPAFVGKSDVYQYARFAAGFRGIRDVSVLPHPGFLEGERLPANTGALVRAHASAVQRCADGAPFVLVGYSAGGLVAHAVAVQLETIGITPAAVVLIDTYSSEDTETWQEAKPGVEQNMLDRNDDPGDVSRGDAWVTAMARYFSFNWWDTRETSAPTLLVQVTDPIGDPSAGDDWKVSWRFTQRVTTLEAPGNHFSVIREHASSTAQAVNNWLTAMFPPDDSAHPQ